MPLIDALKAIAALLVLTHHFSSYGPLAESARQHFPVVFDWLFAYGRMAVQVFLVIAGFLAARGLAASSACAARPWGSRFGDVTSARIVRGELARIELRWISSS